jgi:hypothetical protein
MLGLHTEANEGRDSSLGAILASDSGFSFEPHGGQTNETTIAALVGFRVQTEHPTGSKVVRAEVWAAQQEAGNVTMSRGDWNHGFIERSTAFPFSNVDDEQDAVSGAFAKIGTMARVSVYVAPEDQAEYERTLAQMRGVA